MVTWSVFLEPGMKCSQASLGQRESSSSCCCNLGEIQGLQLLSVGIDVVVWILVERSKVPRISSSGMFVWGWSPAHSQVIDMDAGTQWSIVNRVDCFLPSALERSVALFSGFLPLSLMRRACNSNQCTSVCNVSFSSGGFLDFLVFAYLLELLNAFPSFWGNFGHYFIKDLFLPYSLSLPFFFPPLL